MKTGPKKARQLPQRGALNDLANSDRSLADYAKVSPIQPDEPDTNIIQNLQPVKKIT